MGGDDAAASSAAVVAGWSVSASSSAWVVGVIGADGAAIMASRVGRSVLVGPASTRPGPQVSQIDVGYRDSPLTRDELDGGRVHAGDRAPDAAGIDAATLRHYLTRHLGSSLTTTTPHQSPGGIR